MRYLQSHITKEHTFMATVANSIEGVETVRAIVESEANSVRPGITCRKLSFRKGGPIPSNDASLGCFWDQIEIRKSVKLPKQ